MAESSATPPRVLRIKEVLKRVGLSRSTLYDRMNPASPRYDDSFPKRVKIGKWAVGWLESSINEWINSLVESTSVGKL